MIYWPSLLSLLFNVTSSVGVIMVNKRLVYNYANFRFGTMLTIIHFIVITVSCLFFGGCGYFKVKSFPLRRILPISLAFCGYVVFNNLSLLSNTVSIYQISKIFCTPVIVLIQSYIYRHHQTTSTLLSLVVVCSGIGITFYADSTVNCVGTFWAGAAVIANSLYTIWGKTKQTELNASPMQLLLYQSGTSAILLLFVAGPLDGLNNIVKYEYTFTTCWTITLSCIFAFGVNFSFFLLVGQTSPLTVNVVGYLKTALVFIIEIALGHSNITAQTGFGIVCTLIGLAWYTYIKIQVANQVNRSLLSKVNKHQFAKQQKRQQLNTVYVYLNYLLDKQESNTADNIDDDYDSNHSNNNSSVQ